MIITTTVLPVLLYIYINIFRIRGIPLQADLALWKGHKGRPRLSRIPESFVITSIYTKKRGCPNKIINNFVVFLPLFSVGTWPSRPVGGVA